MIVLSKKRVKTGKIRQYAYRRSIEYKTILQVLCPVCGHQFKRIGYQPTKSAMCIYCHGTTQGLKAKTHGLSKHRIYKIWIQIRQRCLNKKCPAYKHYGGRGIRICREWRKFPAFHAWAKSAGYKPWLCIDREDNNGHYHPSNCRFVTRKVSTRNRRGVHINPKIVRLMRKQFAAGRRPAAVARLFKVSLDTAMKVRKFKTWKGI